MINNSQLERFLAVLFEDDYIVKEAMNYSLLAKSKRIRPLLLLNLLADLDINVEDGLVAASAIEMIHTYSLIHDDLPAFDNDDYRRSKLTCHKAFDESTAILAGDGLLTESFKLIAQSDYDDAVKVKLISLLSEYSGADGMIKGQSLDMNYENEKPDLQQLTDMQLLKTGKLLTVPFLMALAIAEREDLATRFKEIGSRIGLVFQIQDDILDVVSTKEELGKSISDIDNNKTTFVSLIGLEQSKKIVNDLFEQIYRLLGDKYTDTVELIKTIENRKW